MKILLVSLLSLAISSQALAEENPPVPLEHNSKPGIWFELQVAKKMFADLQDYNLLNGKVTLLETKLTLKEEDLNKTRLVLHISEQQLIEQKKATDVETKRANLLQSELDSWLRSPKLWFCVGVVFTGATLYGATQLVN